MSQSMMILIAGPYRSGTGDDPAKMATNLRRLEEAALPIFEKGHVPMIGEWVALPVWNGAGRGAVGDALYDRIFHEKNQPPKQFYPLRTRRGTKKNILEGVLIYWIKSPSVPP